MTKKLTYILSIAGHDPSGGAGILADIKVFEHHRLMGFGAITSITYQNESEFEGVDWLNEEEIIRQLKPLANYPIQVAKIGLVQNLEQLIKLVDELINMFPGIKIIWDPIIKASAGFEFHQHMKVELLNTILKKVMLITPNIQEAKKLGIHSIHENCIKMSDFCLVYLKGGHHPDHSNDCLYDQGKIIKEFAQVKLYGVAKHGSGCVLSSAIAANIALGKETEIACRDAKEYTKDFLISNETLLGQHPSPLIA